MKKIIIAALALIMVISFAACGTKSGSDQGSSGNSQGSNGQNQSADAFELVKIDGENSYSLKGGSDKKASSITVPATYKGKSVTVIAEDAFDGYSNLADVTVEEGIKIIDEYAFNYCQKLESVKLPSTVQSIGKGAFRYTSLKNIIIPEGVTIINASTFYGCKTLEYVVLPASLETVEEMAFDDARAMTAVYYKGTSEKWDTITFNDKYDFEFRDATKYFYSESQPTAEGNYWRFVDGVPTAW